MNYTFLLPVTQKMIPSGDYFSYFNVDATCGSLVARPAYEVLRLSLSARCLQAESRRPRTHDWIPLRLSGIMFRASCHCPPRLT